jgi:hypothetical protein
MWMTGRLAPLAHGRDLTGALDGYLYVALMGAAFGAVGIYLFDRYVDA